MAPRSAIGIKQDNGLIKTIYCHKSGYPHYTGKILFNSYNTQEKVNPLINNGDIYLLKNTIQDTEFFHKYIDEKIKSILFLSDLDDIISNYKHIEYIYIFECNWVCYDINKKRYNLAYYGVK